MSAELIPFPRDNLRDNSFRVLSELASFPDTVPVPPLDPVGHDLQIAADLDVLDSKLTQLCRKTTGVLQNVRLQLADLVYQDSSLRFPSTEDGENEWERIHMNSWEPPVNGGDAA